MSFVPVVSALAIVGATPMSADEIMRRANEAFYYAGDDGMAHGEMAITDKAGRRRSRAYTMLRQDKDKKNGGEQFYYVYFHSPSDVRGTGFLVQRHPDKDDDRWMYLPGLDLVRRIAASDGRTSFVGSHFFYEDVSGRSVSADTHALHEDTAKHYVLKNVPKDPAKAEFGHYLMWIDKETFLPLRADYYDRAGKLVRQIRAAEVKKVNGIPTIMEMRADDLSGGGSTVVRFTEVKYNLAIEQDVFSERYLRNPPRQYVQR